MNPLLIDALAITHALHMDAELGLVFDRAGLHALVKAALAHERATAAPHDTPASCRWPLCQSEEYQAELAAQIHRELYSGEPP